MRGKGRASCPTHGDLILYILVDARLRRTSPARKDIPLKNSVAEASDLRLKCSPPNKFGGATLGKLEGLHS